MSGFFGVINPVGNIDKNAFIQMQNAIPLDRYSELQIYEDDSIAMGHLMQRPTNESAYDQQPVKSSCGKFLLVGYFRLDYRDELGDKLGIEQKVLEKTADSELVIYSYMKWAEKCVTHLEGDWSFALYDSQNRKVILARDPIGFSAIFFTFQNGQIYFSNDPFLFISVQSLKFSLNFLEIDNIVDGRKSISPGQSLFNEVFSLAPGEIVIIDDNQQINFAAYFKEFAISKTLYKNELDYQLDFQSVFMNAIYTRINNVINLGISLSSGRDSTAVFYFANKILEYKKKEISTYTWSSFDSPNISEEKKSRLDESYRVGAMLKEFKFVNPLVIHGFGQRYAHFFSSKKSKNFYNPIVHVNKIWIDEMFYNSKLNQNSLLLVAPFGNFTITWDGPFVNHSLKYELKLFFSLRNRFVSSKKFIKRLITSLVSFFSFRKYRLLRTKRYINDGHLENQIVGKNRIQYDSEKRIKSKIDFLFNKDFELRKKILQRGMINVGATWYLDSYNFGLSVADPTADKRLIEFCLSIPGKYFNYEGRVRYLYKKMMKGKLPDFIINSNKVYPQAYNSGEKLLLDNEIHRLMQEIKKDKYIEGVINVKHMEYSYQNALSNPSTVKNVIAVNNFLKELSVVEFLRKNSNFK